MNGMLQLGVMKALIIIGECFRSLIQGHRVEVEQSSELSERVVN